MEWADGSAWRGAQIHNPHSLAPCGATRLGYAKDTHCIICTAALGSRAEQTRPERRAMLNWLVGIKVMQHQQEVSSSVSRTFMLE